MTTIADRLIEDAGVARGLDRLVASHIQPTIRAVLDGETGARLQTYAETCVRCGLCAKA